MWRLITVFDITWPNDNPVMTHILRTLKSYNSKSCLEECCWDGKFYRVLLARLFVWLFCFKVSSRHKVLLFFATCFFSQLFANDLMIWSKLLTSRQNIWQSPISRQACVRNVTQWTVSRTILRFQKCHIRGCGGGGERGQAGPGKRYANHCKAKRGKTGGGGGGNKKSNIYIFRLKPKIIITINSITIILIYCGS